MPGVLAGPLAVEEVLVRTLVATRRQSGNACMDFACCRRRYCGIRHYLELEEAQTYILGEQKESASLAEVGHQAVEGVAVEGTLYQETNEFSHSGHAHQRPGIADFLQFMPSRAAGLA